MRALPGASATFSDSAFELLPSVGIRSQIPLAELIIYLIMPENPFSLSAFNFRSPSVPSATHRPPSQPHDGVI